MMHTVSQLLDSKGHDVFCVTPGESVLRALEIMAEHDVGALAVMEADNLRGIISERDYARKVILDGRSSVDTKVHEVMTSKVLCASPTQTIPECFALMTDKRIRHLPVLEDNKVVGMLSIGDCVKATIHDQEFVIEQLENYISGMTY
ncbi:MAG: CBS domain-containing protein [Gammaproteobacteria bacterium]